MDPKQQIDTVYGNKIRVRVCGVLIEEDKILFIKHKGAGKKGELWSPPGGGLEFDETIENCLKREFLEETNLKIEVIKFLFLNEFIQNPLHAIELFYQVKKVGGNLKLGSDPEMSDQIISDISFISKKDIQSIGLGFFHGRTLDMFI